MPFSVLKPLVDKIKIKKEQIPYSLKKREEIINKQNLFLSLFSGNERNYYLYGVIVIAGVVFDFILSQITMKPLPPKQMSPIFKAFIFSVIDCGVAILASGVFVKDPVTKVKIMKSFTYLLWFLCFIKLALFLFTQFKLSGKPNILATVFMMILVFLVYLIFKLMGSGLGLIIGQVKYTILKWVYPSEFELKNQLDSLMRKLDNQINLYHFDKNDVIKYFGLE